MSMLKTSLMLAGLLALSTAQAQSTTGTAGTGATKPAAQTEMRTGATMTKDQADAAHDRIEQTAKADKKACEPMKGNAKDICEAEAKAKEKVAKAELKYKVSGEDRDRVKLAELKAEANYEVAKEKCEDQEGDAQRACKKQAKATEDAARAEAKKMAPKG